MPALAPKSAVRDQTVAPDVATEVPPWIARASRTTATRSSPVPRRLLPGSRLGLVPMSLGMLLMLLVVVLGQWVLGWVQTASDDLHYGRPRTFQMDAFVGHETGSTPSHFIALNLQGQIEIIELPGGDATHARIIWRKVCQGLPTNLAKLMLFSTAQTSFPGGVICQF